MMVHGRFKILKGTDILPASTFHLLVVKLFIIHSISQKKFKKRFHIHDNGVALDVALWILKKVFIVSVNSLQRRLEKTV